MQRHLKSRNLHVHVYGHGVECTCSFIIVLLINSQIIGKSCIHPLPAITALWDTCSLLGRLPSANKPKNNMNACADILFTVLKGHYVALACTKLGIDKPTDTPTDFPTLTKREKKLSYIIELAHQVVDNFSINTNAIMGTEVIKSNDQVYSYGRLFCHFGSMALEFRHA